MKKEKMIKIMARHLNNKVMFRDDHEASIRHAHNILELVESFGMSPPFVDEFESDTSLDLVGRRWEDELIDK